jgi:CubicO group peptidase (beta-lactamase class C family)
VIEKVSGKPWEVYVYDSIIEPLGMTNTHALGRGMEQMPDAAKPYTNGFTGIVTELPYDELDNLAPAGSIVSNVKDLSHWIIMQLDSGKYEGHQILPWRVLQRTRQMQTIINSNKSALFPIHYYGYGLGNFQGDYNGRQLYEHTGGADGFVTNVCFVPEENLGISILTNNDNQEFFEALRYQILDAYLGVKYVNRGEQAFAFFKPAFDTSVAHVKALQARIKGIKAPLDLKEYLGEYDNQLYGKVNITQDKKDLLIHFENSKNLTATLQYLDNDEWLLTYSNPAYGIFPLKFITEKNKVISMSVKVNDFLEYDPYTFTKEQ